MRFHCAICPNIHRVKIKMSKTTIYLKLNWNLNALKRNVECTHTLHSVLSITLLSTLHSCYFLICFVSLIFFFLLDFVLLLLLLSFPLFCCISPSLTYKKIISFSPLSFCFLFGKKMGVVRIELTTSWLWDTRSTDWATLPSVHRTSVFYITKFNPWASYFYCSQSIHVNLLWWSLFDLLTYVHCWKHKSVSLK